MIFMEEDNLFWSDQLAKKVVERQKFHYVDKQIPKSDKYVVKTSASLSGVLHIGRLSDTVRGESVVKSLRDAGHEVEFIWVAEDMDPLRKVPKCVPSIFEKYLGMPVTDIPDPWGCHKTYSEHHFEKYLKVLYNFTHEKMTMYSMREEYKKGTFRDSIKTLLENSKKMVEIQNKYRDNKLPETWSPWTPICKNCGKIITPKVLGFDGKKIHYRCEDYKFETTVAKGCGYEGEADPLHDDGKLMWKGEWASQWRIWKVCSEGAGKEYQVPGSAFWINCEICESILDYPAPEPIFYEHITIDGEKMSASKGNIVYPNDWAEVADPEVLRFFYNKKLMKTRSFSWKDLPRLYDDYDLHTRVYFDAEKLENEREAHHMKRLFEISQLKIPSHLPKLIPYDFAAIIAQICPPEDSLDRAITLLKSSGHITGNPDAGDLEFIKHRLLLAKNWTEKYAGEEVKIKISEEVTQDMRDKLNENQLKTLGLLAKSLDSAENEAALYSKFFEISKETGIDTKEFFKGAYNILTGKDRGPRLAPFIFAIGKERVKKLLNEL
jgi:lysyl-tRNA synthetase class 1